jgi:hypothetical protein
VSQQVWHDKDYSLLKGPEGQLFKNVFSTKNNDLEGKNPLRSF